MNRRSVLTGAGMALAGLATVLAWALASAPGSAPDDNYHLASIWCADGGDATCPDVPGHPEQMRPPPQVPGAPCFSQNSDASAKCQENLTGELEPGKPFFIGNWNAKSYPPLFYATMNQFVTDSLYNSVMLMRAVNGFLVVGLVAALVIGLPRRLKPLGVVPLVVTAVPLSLSLISSTNPSAWAITGSAAVWPALYAAFETRGRRRALLLAVFLVGVLLASGSRGDAALFTIVGIGLVGILRFRELLRHRLVVGVAAAGFAIATYFFLTSGQSTVVVSGGFGIEPEEVFPWYQVAIANFQDLPNLWVGSLGFGFMASAGWLDTPFPAIVGFSATAVWAAYVFGSWREMYLAKLLGVVSIAAAMIVYPLVMLGLTGVFVGTGFQPRYLLPLLVILTGVSMLSRRVVASPFTTFQAVAATVALSIAQSVALHTQIRRYVTGLDVKGWNLDQGREWWWDIPLPATVTWIVGSVAFACLVWWLLRPAGMLGRTALQRTERQLARRRPGSRRSESRRGPERRPEKVGS